MTNHDGYTMIGAESSDISPEEKRKLWDVAIGLNQVDNLFPSDYLKDLIEESAQGRSSYRQIEAALHKYYDKQDLLVPNISAAFECDIVSTRIAALLEDPSFVFSPIYLKTIHARLFNGVWKNTLRDYAGRFQDYNISKDEPILNGRSVIYGEYSSILEYLKYDFEDEQQHAYEEQTEDAQVKRRARRRSMSNYEKAVALWRRKNVYTDAELAEALNGHSIAFAYHSGKIENENITYNDTREIFDHDGVTSYTGDLRTLFEIRNAKDANELFLTAFGEKRSITEELLQAFQKQLTKNTYDTRRYQLGEQPGEYKKHDYVTGKAEVGAAPTEVADEMSELIDEIQDIPDSQALKAAAYFHAKFENIHPFADGNGRAGRLAMNYFLILHGHPPIVIHEEDRKAYYSALEAWDSVQSLDPLVEFLTTQTEKTWMPQISRAYGQDKAQPSLKDVLHADASAAHVQTAKKNEKKSQRNQPER